MRSVMTHQFSQVPRAEIQRSSFDRSHGYKTTFDAGYLIPIFCDEVLPGDTFNLKMQGFARMATPIYPIMDNMFMETFFFFVPYRLVWENWQKFMGEQANPSDTTDYTVPTVNINTITAASGGGLFDYMGFPLGTAATVSLPVSTLPLRAYNLIWNEWFRDQNLQDSATIWKGDTDAISSYKLLKRGKRHDYFTSCLPWPQKGDAVSLPLQGNATVMTSANPIRTGAGSALTFAKTSDGTKAAAVALGINTNGQLEHSGAKESPTQGAFYPNNLYADLSTITSATINDLRQSFQVQRLLERDARGGTRYTEIVKSHFGVTSPDARLQRPEYLGGGKLSDQYLACCSGSAHRRWRHAAGHSGWHRNRVPYQSWLHSVFH